MLNFTPQLIADAISIAATGMRMTGMRSTARNGRRGVITTSSPSMPSRAALIPPWLRQRSAESAYDVRLVVGDAEHTIEPGGNHGAVILPDALRWLWHDSVASPRCRGSW